MNNDFIKIIDVSIVSSCTSLIFLWRNQKYTIIFNVDDDEVSVMRKKSWFSINSMNWELLVSSDQKNMFINKSCYKPNLP